MNSDLSCIYRISINHILCPIHYHNQFLQHNQGKTLQHLTFRVNQSTRASLSCFVDDRAIGVSRSWFIRPNFRRQQWSTHRKHRNMNVRQDILGEITCLHVQISHYKSIWNTPDCHSLTDSDYFSHSICSFINCISIEITIQLNLQIGCFR